MSNTHPFPASDSDFSEMDDAQISSHHWKIMFISGMGFFTDAYDLFIIGVVMTLLKPIWHVSPLATPQAQRDASISSSQQHARR